MSTGDRQRVSGYKKSRTRNYSLIDPVSYGNVSKAGALTVQIAHRCEAGFEIAFGGGDCLDGAEGLGLGNHWRCSALVFGLEEHVSVTIYEAGQNCVTGEVDDFGAGWNGDGRADLFDPFTAYDDDCVLRDRSIGRIEQPSAFYRGHLGVLCDCEFEVAACQG